MEKEKLKSTISSFSPDGDYLAILSLDGLLKVWNTSDGRQLSEWTPTGENTDLVFTCIACCSAGKKRKKGRGICLVALGTEGGDILVINISTGELKWKSTGSHSGGIVSLSFKNKGHTLHVVGSNGIASERNPETGELLKEFKVSKKSIPSPVYLSGATDEQPEVVAGSMPKENSKNKRSSSHLDNPEGAMIIDNGENPMDGIQIDADPNEPTMGEKLASLTLVESNETNNSENNKSSSLTKPPSADSVHVLLKQALHADDRALLIDCLYRQDDKVIANSVSLLNPYDVLKLLRSLVSMIQSRGAVLACALPWLKSLLLQHASGIMSQEASLLALNSLYQLIESRVSTFDQALQLSSRLDLLYAGLIDDGEDEKDAVTPFVYEDKDESDEEGSEGAMETESDQDNVEPEVFNDISDFEGNDGMSE